MIYADNAATTRMSEAAVEAMAECIRNGYGNASSLYTFGQEAKERLEKARGDNRSEKTACTFGMKTKKEESPMKKMICTMITLVLLLAAVCAASAETIQAKPVTININHLEGRMVKTDIDYKEGDIMTLTLYENERFDAAAIRAAKVGDVIVTDGEEITIESIEADGPDIIFNKGTENEMLFCDTGNDEFERVMENDYVPWIRLGTMDVEILEYYPILDAIDPITGDLLEEYAIYRGDRLKELLQNPDAVGFNCKNVDIVYDRNNQPVLMRREFSSAQ